MKIDFNRTLVSPRKLELVSERSIPKPNWTYKPNLPVIRKSAGCADCPYRTIGAGFCPDTEIGAEAKICTLLEAPGETEIEEGVPLSGKAGKLWARWLIEDLGYSRDEVVICNTLRCRPKGSGRPKDAWNTYPTGKLRAQAEAYCRQYDDKLTTWEPNVFVVTMHPAALLRTPAFLKLVQSDMRRAFRMADQGLRPLVLMGDKAMGLCSPWLAGGVKTWRGHWWVGKLHRRYA